MEAPPEVQPQSPEFSILTWHPIPCLASLLPASGWLVVGVCSTGLDTGASRPEICVELASKAWAPRKATFIGVSRDDGVGGGEVRSQDRWLPRGKGACL